MKAHIEELKELFPSGVATFEKAMSGTSQTSGVKAKCQQCSGYSRTDVTYCLVTTCPLLPYRPYQKKGSEPETTEDDEASNEDDVDTDDDPEDVEDDIPSF